MLLQNLHVWFSINAAYRCASYPSHVSFLPSSSFGLCAVNKCPLLCTLTDKASMNSKKILHFDYSDLKTVSISPQSAFNELSPEKLRHFWILFTSAFFLRSSIATCILWMQQQTVLRSVSESMQ